MNRKTTRGALAALLAASALAWAGPAAAQEKLTIWWIKSFYQSEDTALRAMIRKFEKKTGVQVELSEYTGPDSMAKSVAALDAGVPPDVAYSDVYDFQVTSKWAFEGKLEDLTDVITPLKTAFLPNTIETTLLYNDTTKARAYYAFPLKQNTIHVNYWIDMLAEAGYKESDIPSGWHEYWSFWCDKVQPAYRKKTGTRVYAIGNPMGVDSADSYQSFLSFIDAYGVKLVDDNGKLRVDDPKVKAGLVGALRDYTDIYQKGCTPPSSTTWKDPDNNIAFHTRTTLMTHNATISIAAKWFDDSTNDALTPEQRAKAKQSYDSLIRTAGFPKKADGSPMVYRASVKTGVIFQAAKNKKRAKEFVTFMMQDENLTPYVEGALGRWFPVTKSGAQQPFWKADPHRLAVLKQFQAGTIPYEMTKNWRFTILNNENVWARAMNRVVNEKVSPEQAVDELIHRIKAIAG